MDKDNNESFFSSNEEVSEAISSSFKKDGLIFLRITKLSLGKNEIKIINGDSAVILNNVFNAINECS